MLRIVTDRAKLPRTSHLRVVPNDAEPPPQAGDALWQFVRAARRDMARLLRALVSSGRGLGSLPDPVVTRLAHVDAVTARYLLEGVALADPEIRAATESMRALEAWIVEHLSAAALAEVRRHEIGVRIDEQALVGPLVRTDFPGEEPGPSDAAIDPHERRTLRQGLANRSNAELADVCRRLGLGVPGLPWRDDDAAREAAQRSVLDTLLDGHLLAILVATLPAEAHRLLAALVRDELDPASLERLAVPHVAPDPRSFGVTAVAPTQVLCGCALAFTDGGRLWVPAELHRRVDGVLRAFGI